MTQLEKLMATLDLTEDEAKALMADDAKIDKGEKLFELDDSQKQVEKQMRQADRAVNAYGKKVQRERKADDDKRYLMRAIKGGLFTYAGIKDETAINVINAEREIEFMFNGKKYKIVLSAPRK